MPDPLSHHPSMLRVDESLPPFWWLNPWSTALRLHQAVLALKHLSDLDEACLSQTRSLADEYQRLQYRVAYMRFAGDQLVRVCEEHAPGLYSKQEVSRWAAACDE